MLGDNTLFDRAKIGRGLTMASSKDCTEKHMHTLRLRQEGTCKWLPNTDAYKNWRVGGNQFLWLHGKGTVSDTLRVSTADTAYSSTCL